MINLVNPNIKLKKQYIEINIIIGIRVKVDLLNYLTNQITVRH